jgi:hypothetical protein
MSSYQWDGSSTGVWATGANWTPSGPPADTDTAIFDFTSASGTAVAGGDNSTTELAVLRIDSTYTQAFGDNGSPVIVDATLVEIGRPSGGSTAGAGSGRINLSLPDVVSTVRIYAGKTTGNTDTGKEPIRIKTGANANFMYVTGAARVGVATDSIGDTAQFTTISCQHANATIIASVGVTLTNWRQSAGTGTLFGSVTNLLQDAGTVTQFGSGTITAASIGGTANLNSSGTVTAATVFNGGHLDLSDSLPKTVTTLTLHKGAKVTYDPAIITITNPIVLSGCTTEDVTIIVPEGRTVVIA